MTKDAIIASYQRSFVCVLLFAAMFSASCVIADLVLHHRTLLEWLLMPWVMAVMSTIVAALIFTLPQCFEAWLACRLVSRFGDDARAWTLAALPLTAVLTWYCYDYLTPPNLGINVPPGAEYHHGITMQRYSMALAAQTLVTLLNIVFLEFEVLHRSRRVVVIAVLVLVALSGPAFAIYRHAQDVAASSSQSDDAFPKPDQWNF